MNDFEEFDGAVTSLDPQEIRSRFSEYDSQKLCDIIVCDRYLGINKELAIYCMEELARRRSNGDVFDFESYIDSAYKDLPPIELSIFDLKQSLQDIMGKFRR